ncbi:MAG TPA: nucleotidyltransferase family protein [Burkholderiaceae bacterium]|nr:nucleotidyltransferase family protein [Burkholderiaceae bacterium]
MRVVRPTVIVLAAGKGSRFQGDTHKLEQDIGSVSVFGSTLKHVIASHLPLIVVTTEGLEPSARRLVAARDVVVVPEAGARSDKRMGMGFSIASGVSARPDAPGWLIMPADMPLIQPSTLLAVARALEHHPVAYAQYKGRRGHPVAFASELYSELVMLTGDEGARRLTARYPAFGVEVDDPGVLIDVDTPEDLTVVRACQAEHAVQHPLS